LTRFGRLTVNAMTHEHPDIPSAFQGDDRNLAIAVHESLRLTHARQMLQGGGRVKAVAHDVGYESESQFSREYRRFFGVPLSGEGGSYAPASSGRVSLAS
jgi:AraC-like DNA-binding protein